MHTYFIFYIHIYMCMSKHLYRTVTKYRCELSAVLFQIEEPAPYATIQIYDLYGFATHKSCVP